MRPISGLYAVTPDWADTAALAGTTEAILAAGARLLQYRNKTATAQLRREQAAVLGALCRRHHAAFIVNDDVELARETGADGVHIGRDDMRLADARAQLGSGKIIGVSCYDAMDRAREAARGGADYVAFGSFFPSTVKPKAVRAPLSLLTEARALGRPVVAIGGITLDNASPLVRAGADAIAVISALFDAPDPADAASGFGQLFEVHAA